MESSSLQTLTTENSYQDFDEEDGDTIGFYAEIDLPLIFMSLLILAENFIVVALITKKEALRRVTANIILASLAVGDFFSGLVGIPLLIGCSAARNAVCIATEVFIRFSAVVSVLHLLFIAFDRYFRIVRVEYDTLITRTRAVSAIFFIWFFSLLASLVQLSWYKVHEINVNEDAEEKARRIEVIYLVVCLALFYILPLVIMCCLYARIFSISLRQTVAIRQQRVTVQRPVPLLIVELRGSVVMATMMVVFAGCWLPYFMIVIEHQLGEESTFETPLWFEHLVVFLRFTPPLLNPLLCAFCKRDIRKTLFASFRRAMLRPRLETRRERVSTRKGMVTIL